MVDAREAYEVATANGAVSVQPPTVLHDGSGGGSKTVSEVVAYGDCVLRFVSGDFKVCFHGRRPPPSRLQATFLMRKVHWQLLEAEVWLAEPNFLISISIFTKLPGFGDRSS